MYNRLTKSACVYLEGRKKTRTHLKSEDDTEESVEVDFVCVKFVFHFVPTSLKAKPIYSNSAKALVSSRRTLFLLC